MNQAIKCICRSRLPFPVLHIDSTWKFNEMIAFRDRTAQHLGLDLLVHVNEEGRAAGVGRFTHGSGLHTYIMKNPGTETGTRSMRLRRGLRRRAARRGEGAGQGAGIFFPNSATQLGPEDPAPGTLEALQYP